MVVALPTERLVPKNCVVPPDVAAVPDAVAFAEPDVKDIGVRVNVVSFDMTCTSLR